MAVQGDHAIANRVRTILDRLWIDDSALDFGSVGGIVYVRGVLHHRPAYARGRGRRDTDAGLIHVLERELRMIDGVKDVSIEVRSLEDG